MRIRKRICLAVLLGSIGAMCLSGTGSGGQAEEVIAEEVDDEALSVTVLSVAEVQDAGVPVTETAGTGKSATEPLMIEISDAEYLPTEVSAAEPAVKETPGTDVPDTEPPTIETPDTEPLIIETPDTEPPMIETPDTEPPMIEAPDTEPPVIEAPDTEAPVTEAPGGGDSEEIFLGIDNGYAYDGMGASFRKGYTPAVENGAFTIVIPFTASGRLKEEKLTVDLDFGEAPDAPFRFSNYQKDVWQKTHTVQTKNGEETRTAYLYRCTVDLQEGAAPGQYPVLVKASAYTESGKKITLDTRLYVQVPAEAMENAALPEQGDGGGFAGDSTGGAFGGSETEALIRQPKMLLESYNLAEESLKAGETQMLLAAFQNRSKSQSMYNLKVTLSTENQSVRLKKKSYYFSRVAPQETIELENEVEISRNITESIVPVQVTFEYEDEKGTAAQGTEELELSVLQPVSVELETVGIPASVYASDTLELSVKALNLSRTAVYNVRVRLEGTGLFPTEEVFIGNMEAGTAGEGTMRIYVGTRTMKAVGEETGMEDTEKYGPAEGTLTLEYEDFLGNSYETVRTYQTEIKKAQVLSLNVEEEAAEENDWWISVSAVLIAGMSALILLLFLGLRRKNSLLEEARKEVGR